MTGSDQLGPDGHGGPQEVAALPAAVGGGGSVADGDDDDGDVQVLEGAGSAKRHLAAASAGSAKKPKLLPMSESPLAEMDIKKAMEEYKREC